MIIQYINFKSELPEEEILKIAKEREPQFKAIPGLIQKYYVKPTDDGQYGGVYVWDSKESMEAFRSSELAAGIPAAYKISGPSNIEILDVLFQLRD